ncbi:MAG TPA: HAMP domain-containing sensor histidine kinase [Alphaproteobacteria bacterium]|nr:HAMP domain-containing sensor histidine kinase [Alphaproteobacteria bacterium]
MAAEGGDDNAYKLPPAVTSLSARLLMLTVAFVMLTEVAIFVPSIARFRLVFLDERLAKADLASLALEATPDGMVSEALARRLLEQADSRAIVIRGADWRRLIQGSAIPGEVGAAFDLRRTSPLVLIGDAFAALWPHTRRLIRVFGASQQDPGLIVETIIDERPMVDAMYGYARRILNLSIVISLVTAMLVYFSLYWLMVRPMRRVTQSMVEFRHDPEDPASAIVPSARSDEIGTAQRELAAMQSELAQSLRQKTRLAELGTAMSKISHDLRNILATAQLVSDRIAISDDPEVSRLAPRLSGAIDRAVDLTSDTLKFVQTDEIPIRRSRFALGALVEEVGASVGRPEDDRLAWHNEVADDLVINADREQLFRALMNLGRNAVQAIVGQTGRTEKSSGSVAISAGRNEGRLWIDIADSGPGLPEDIRDDLFKAFGFSSTSGGMGLGLAIANDIVRAHGGGIEVVATGAEGTRLRLRLAEI